MSEHITIQEGKYHHIEGLTYLVVGIARITPPMGFTAKPQYLNTALSVEGYEDTHQVTGYPIQVYKVSQDKSNSLVYVKTGNFSSPDCVAVYEQLEEGKQYHKGQWWWRSVDNFKKYFTPVVEPTQYGLNP